VNKINLSSFTNEERDYIYKKYKIIEPYINKECSLKSIARNRKIPLRTLTSWVQKYKSLGLVALARQSRKDKGVSRSINTNLINIVKALYLEHPSSSCATIHRLILKHCEYGKLVPPSYRSICNIISLIPDDIVTLSHKGSKAYKQKYDLLHTRNADKPNQIWQADHVLMDIEILNDKNRPHRPWLTIIIDDCSRVICGYELSFLSPSAYKTSLCLRYAIWRKSDPKWPVLGAPEILYTDHGSDFTSKHIEQVCINLKIQLIFSQISQPRGRGKIERFFRTLNQKLISDLSIITQDRKNKNLLTLKQLDQLVYKFIIEYNTNIHSELKISPVDKWLKDGFLPNIVDSLESLDLLLLTEIKLRTVHRDGIYFQGLRYFDILLAEYIGQKVIIRYTPSDITSIRVFFQDQFLCQPICAELSNQTIGIKEVQQVRNKRRYLLKKEIKQQKSLISALISSSRKELGLEDVSEQIEEQIITNKPVVSKIKLYRNE